MTTMGIMNLKSNTERLFERIADRDKTGYMFWLISGEWWSAKELSRMPGMPADLTTLYSALSRRDDLEKLILFGTHRHPQSGKLVRQIGRVAYWRMKREYVESD